MGEKKGSDRLRRLKVALGVDDKPSALKKLKDYGFSDYRWNKWLRGSDDVELTAIIKKLENDVESIRKDMDTMGHKDPETSYALHKFMRDANASKYKITRTRMSRVDLMMGESEDGESVQLFYNPKRYKFMPNMYVYGSPIEGSSYNVQVVGDYDKRGNFISCGRP